MPAFLKSREACYQLKAPRTTIGRHEGCDIVLQTAGVADRHAALEFTASIDSFVLTDFNSRYGTFVNGCQIQDASVKVNAGDILRFGAAGTSFELVVSCTPVGRRTARNRQLQVASKAELSKFVPHPPLSSPRGQHAPASSSGQAPGMTSHVPRPPPRKRSVSPQREGVTSSIVVDALRTLSAVRPDLVRSLQREIVEKELKIVLLREAVEKMKEANRENDEQLAAMTAKCCREQSKQEHGAQQLTLCRLRIKKLESDVERLQGEVQKYCAKQEMMRGQLAAKAKAEKTLKEHCARQALRLQAMGRKEELLRANLEQAKEQLKFFKIRVMEVCSPAAAGGAGEALTEEQVIDKVREICEEKQQSRKRERSLLEEINSRLSREKELSANVEVFQKSLGQLQACLRIPCSSANLREELGRLEAVCLDPSISAIGAAVVEMARMLLSWLEGAERLLASARMEQMTSVKGLPPILQKVVKRSRETARNYWMLQAEKTLKQDRARQALRLQAMGRKEELLRANLEQAKEQLKFFKMQVIQACSPAAAGGAEEALTEEQVIDKVREICEENQQRQKRERSLLEEINSRLSREKELSANVEVFQKSLGQLQACLRIPCSSANLREELGRLEAVCLDPSISAIGAAVVEMARVLLSWLEGAERLLASARMEQMTSVKGLLPTLQKLVNNSQETTRKNWMLQYQLERLQESQAALLQKHVKELEAKHQQELERKMKEVVTEKDKESKEMLESAVAKEKDKCEQLLEEGQKKIQDLESQLRSLTEAMERKAKEQEVTSHELQAAVQKLEGMRVQEVVLQQQLPVLEEQVETVVEEKESVKVAEALGRPASGLVNLGVRCRDQRHKEIIRRQKAGMDQLRGRLKMLEESQASAGKKKSSEPRVVPVKDLLGNVGRKKGRAKEPSLVPGAAPKTIKAPDAVPHGGACEAAVGATSSEVVKAMELSEKMYLDIISTLASLMKMKELSGMQSLKQLPQEEREQAGLQRQKHLEKLLEKLKKLKSCLEKKEEMMKLHESKRLKEESLPAQEPVCVGTQKAREPTAEPAKR